MTRSEITQRIRGRAAVAQRQRILYRDNGLCQPCERMTPPRLTAATEVDHRLALFLGGTNDDSNQESICSTCHKAKSARERGYKTAPRCGVDGLPLSPDHPWNKDAHMELPDEA